jgi:pimeloyl-ACP methyl ester carboxylesterase
LLHGVYFDHHLWDYQISKIKDRTVVTIDMPLHGESREIIKPDWTLSDCADMLIEILDKLNYEKVIAAGHSWGSMTILRAASKHPERFEAIGLCNMPFKAATSRQRRLFRLQHAMLTFRKFYTKQAAKSLFGDTSLSGNPDLLKQLERPMNRLSGRQVREIDKKVIVDAEDATPLILDLKMRAMALKGAEDYVPTPSGIQTVVIEGGHVSPLEQPDSVLEFLKSLTTNNPSLESFL